MKYPLPFRSIVYCLISIIIFTQCSTYSMLPANEKYQRNIRILNDLADKYSSDLILLDGTEIICEELKVVGDSLSYTDKNKLTATIHKANVDKVILKDTVASIFSGFWIGLATAFVTTLIGSAIINSPSETYGMTAIGLFILSFPLGVTGGIIFSGEKEFCFLDGNVISNIEK